MERGIRLIGNGQAPVHLYWEKLLEMIQNGQIDPLMMVTHRVLMEELDIIYSKFGNRGQNAESLCTDQILGSAMSGNAAGDQL